MGDGGVNKLWKTFYTCGKTVEKVGKKGLVIFFLGGFFWRVLLKKFFSGEKNFFRSGLRQKKIDPP
jgi:hypothetical protein